MRMMMHHGMGVMMAMDDNGRMMMTVMHHHGATASPRHICAGLGRGDAQKAASGGDCDCESEFHDFLHTLMNGMIRASIERQSFFKSYLMEDSFPRFLARRKNLPCA
jgi:hypothetical protein